MDNSQNPDPAANNGNLPSRSALREMSRAQGTRTPARNESRRNSDSMDSAYDAVVPSAYSSPYRNNVSALVAQGSAAPISGNSAGSAPAPQGLAVGNGTNGLRINHANFWTTYGHIDTTSNRTFDADFAPDGSSSTGTSRLSDVGHPSMSPSLQRSASSIHPTTLTQPVLPSPSGCNSASSSVGPPRLPNAARPSIGLPLPRSASSIRPTILAPPVLPPLYECNSTSFPMRHPRPPNVTRTSMDLPLPRPAFETRSTAIVPPVLPTANDNALFRGLGDLVIRLPGMPQLNLSPTYADAIEGYHRVDRNFVRAQHLVRLEMNETRGEESTAQYDDAQERLRLLNRAHGVNRNLMNEVLEHPVASGPIHSGHRPCPTFQELALGYLLPAVPGSGNPLEVCTLCRFMCDFGISEEIFWLPQEASAGLCDYCKPVKSTDSLGNWSIRQYMDLLLFDKGDEDEYMAPSDEEYEETLEEKATQVEIERIAKHYQVAAPSPYNTISIIDKTNTEKHRGPLFCRNQAWRQANVHMTRICPDCRTEKLNIIKHDHEKFSPIVEEIQRDEKGEQLPRDPNNRRCMYCPQYATDKCDGCPLRLCCSCEVLLRVSFKKSLDKLFYYHHRSHHRNDAFLLRGDGGEF